MADHKSAEKETEIETGHRNPQHPIGLAAARHEMSTENATGLNLTPSAEVWP